MKFYLLIFEGLGTQELILILVVALIVFGPKKLPQLARSFGKSMSEFKRASEEFKQQWEKEVELVESAEKSIKSELSLVEDDDDYDYKEKTISRTTHTGALTNGSETEVSSFESSLETSEITTEISAPEIKEVEPASMPEETANESETSSAQKTSKRDWL